ncbi:MAG: hypothetical protein VKI83_04700, partial [Synechococcaceae cyanobacterium]|nr:hypothetical protein [Synechococcaceae cyanobacterium]
DGAHNPPAAEALRRELSHRDGIAPRRWLLGIQRHKEAQVMLPSLLAPGDLALITPIPGHCSWSVAELAAACPVLAAQLEAVEDLQTGLAALIRPLAPGLLDPADPTDPAGSPVPRGEPPLPVVAGSLHLLGAVLPLLDAELS